MKSGGRTPRLLWACFFLTGATGLIYEVLWTRELTLVFGTTTFASSTVLAVFMGGFALGSWLFGRWIDRVARPLLVYAALEAAVGLYALALPKLYARLPALDAAILPPEPSFAVLTLYRFAVSTLLLLLPTVLMGGTFPILTRAVVRSVEEAGSRIGLLYAVNTFGAVLGAFLAGFALIPLAGTTGTLRLAVGIDIAVAALVATLMHSAIEIPLQPVKPASEAAAKPPRDDRAERRRLFAILAIGVSGFAALLYEVVWTRALATVFGSSVYALSTMLTAFLAGIALGSLIYSARIRRGGTDALTLLGNIQLRIAFSAALFACVLMILPEIYILIIRHFSSSFGWFSLFQFLLVFVSMLYMTTMLGAVFPVTSKLYLQAMQSVGKDTGALYASNTLGAIAGALFSGFLFVPALGIPKTTMAGILLNLLVGAAAILFYFSREKAKRVVPIVAVVLLLAGFIPWWWRANQKILTYGVYAYAYRYSARSEKADLNRTVEIPSPFGPLVKPARSPVPPGTGKSRGGSDSDSRVLFFKDGLTATVAVTEDAQGERTLLINGKADASSVSWGDMRTQLLLGHLPALLYRGPKESAEALVIGLGSGTTLGALEKYDFRHFDCVEIEEAVEEACRLYFSGLNGNALEDPRTRMILEDGRNHLQRTGKKYAIITSEPSNLWMAGVSNLFTREYFTIAKRALTENGIFCQWVHLYQISPQDIRIFLRTFASVFGHVTLWADGPDMLVLGSDTPFSLDEQGSIEKGATETILADLRRGCFYSLDEVLRTYTGSSRGASLYADRAPLNTDTHPILEFSAPKSLAVDRSREILYGLASAEATASETRAEREGSKRK
jgi:spermidine synthase